MGMVCDFIKSSKEFGRLFKQVDNHTERLKAQEKDINSNKNNIDSLFQYFNKTDEGELQHIYDSFPLLYNKEYVKDVLTHIKVDLLGGIVYYDLRLLMKKDLPIDTPVVVAKCPLDYQPSLSAPTTWIVRNGSFSNGVYTPNLNPLISDGKGVFSHMLNEVNGWVTIRAKDVVSVDQFLYLSGSYFMMSKNVGKTDLNKGLIEDETFVLEGNL